MDHEHYKRVLEQNGDSERPLFPEHLEVMSRDLRGPDGLIFRIRNADDTVPPFELGDWFLCFVMHDPSNTCKQAVRFIHGSSDGMDGRVFYLDTKYHPEEFVSSMRDTPAAARGGATYYKYLVVRIMWDNSRGKIEVSPTQRSAQCPMVRNLTALTESSARQIIRGSIATLHRVYLCVR